METQFMRMSLMVKSFAKMETADRAWLIQRLVADDHDLRYPIRANAKRIRRKLKEKRKK